MKFQKIYKTLLVSSLLIGGNLFKASAQDFIYEWGYNLGGAGNDNGKGITTDNNKDVILVTEFNMSFDADPGAGTTTLTSAGGQDIAISKFDSDGNLIWAISIGGTGNDNVYSVKTDQDNNIFVSGGFRNTVDFNPGIDVEDRTSNGGLDFFLLKLDTNGEFEWVYTNGSAVDEDGRDFVIDHNGDINLSGYFRSTVDFDLGSGTAELTSLGGADIFVLKLTNDGDFISVYHVGGTSDEDAYGIAVDLNNNIYLTGYFQGTVDFDAGIGVSNLTTAGSNDVFILKINSTGTFGWARRIGSTGADGAWALEIDKNSNIVLGGYFSGTVDFDPGAGVDNKMSVGGRDLFIVKLDNNGNYIWSVTAGGTADDEIWGIAIDDNNNIFSVGFFRNTADFDPSIATANLTATGPGFADQFYWKLDEDGNYLFATNIGGTNNDHSFDIEIDGQFIYTTGYFTGTADLNFTSDVSNVTTTGGSDVSFMKHINCNPIHTNDVIVSCGPITWIDGNSYSTDNNTAVHVLPNMYGCDSTVHLNLMIKAIDDYTVTPSETTLCDDGDITVETASSQAGVFYSLVNQTTMAVLDGPFEGDGTALTFDAGNISTTTTYEVHAERNKYNALTFTGNSTTPTYVSLGNNINKVFAGTNEITVEAWVNSDNNNNLQSVVSTYNGLGNTMQFLIRLDHAAGQNKAAFWIGTGSTPGAYTSVVGTTTITPDTWYHIAGTYDGTNISIYVNGVLENQVAVSTLIPNVNNDLRIGGGLNTNTEYFYGDITGVRIWNVAKTETEINDNMDVCIPGNENGLVAMYNMVNGTGSSTLTDESINGYNGTLMNMNASTSWNYTNMPAISCSNCNTTMTETPTVTVNYSNNVTDVQLQCDNYTWIDGIEYTSSNNTATFMLTNEDGCDSLVTLNLTITNINSTVTNTSPTLTAVETGATYQWVDCDNGNAPISGETNQSFTASANGNYAVIITKNGCSETSDCAAVSNVGINDNNAIENLTVYPNPTNGNITIDLGENHENFTIKITNTLGQVIQNSNYSNSQKIDIQIDGERGIYFIEIITENGTSNIVKLIKN